MSKHNNGGPAFPSAPEADKIYNRINSGITLRDYFAAKAMQGMYAADTNQSVMPLNMKVAEAYAAADAMLKAREVGE